MAADFIKIARDQSAATESAELLSTVHDLRSVYERLTRIRAKMRHCFDDSGGANTIDWSAVETNWGVPAGGTSVGPTAQGAAVFTLIDGATGAMEGSFQNTSTVDLSTRVG
jgi:hypothetical protein